MKITYLGHCNTYAVADAAENGELLKDAAIKIDEETGLIISVSPRTLTLEELKESVSKDTDITYIDCSGRDVLPGSIDSHLHFAYEQGGFKIRSADSFESGSAACLLGGTTSVIDFVEPDVNNHEHAESAILRRIKDTKDRCFVDYSLHYSIIFPKSEEGKTEYIISQIQEAAKCGCKSFKLYTVYDGLKIDTVDQLQLVMSEIAKVKGIAMVHCENDTILQENLAKLNAEGKIDPKYIPLSRPPIGEIESTTRVLLTAELFGTDVHIAHVTLSDGANLVRTYRKRRSADKINSVTGEVTGHHIYLTNSLYETNNIHLVMAPPLQTAQDINGLRQSLAKEDDDTGIQMVCSDHCPFNWEQRLIMAKLPKTDIKYILDVNRKDVFRVIGTEIVSQEKINTEFRKQMANKIPETEEESLETVQFWRRPGGTAGCELRFIIGYDNLKANGASLKVISEKLSENAAKRFALNGKGVLRAGYDADITVVNPYDPWIVTKNKLHENADHTLFQNVRINSKVEKVFKGGVLCVDDGKLIAVRMGKCLLKKQD